MFALRQLPLIAVAFLIVCRADLLAQPGKRPQAPRSLRDVTIEGTVDGVQGNMLQMKLSTGHPYLVALQPNFSQVGVTGTAKPDYLKPGTLVSFTADLPKDKKVELSEPLAELEILASSESLGLFNADRDNKESTKFIVRGTVRSYKDGSLVVAAGGKQISATVPLGLDIKLQSTDLGIVRPGDGIKVAGKQVQAYRGDGNNIQPGQVIGQTIDITLQEPLTATTFKKKSSAK
jgi:hypothetical protein